MSTSKSTAKSTSSAARVAKPAARRAQPPDRTDDTPDAIKLLTDDHKEVKKLFKAYEKLAQDEATGQERQELAERICVMLIIHMTIEEDMLYPLARQAFSEKALMDEAEVEHASAKELIAQIQSMNPDDALYDAKVRVLGEYIDHHVKEEESEMFPKLKKAKLDIDRLGDEMAGRKQALTAEAEAQSVH